MGLRAPAVVVALALLGTGIGYAAGGRDAATPQELATAPTPVTAVGPAYPRDRPVTVKEDPDDPAMQRNLPTHPETLGGAELGLTVPVPDGWSRTTKTLGEWRFFIDDPATPGLIVKPDTYFMRITLVGSRHQPVAQALDDRINALAGAQDVRELDVESRSSDTFVGTYVSGGYRRVTMERFISSPGSPGEAYALVALIGRERDRAGLSSLLEKVTDAAVDDLATRAG
ncbi:hypothetical protein K8Z61_14520 [Nocardioides sp. TRM66260-LWL]|uniref:hypothetical protein n=1 Tax=Nocardioides sp. TRM66260-LWL TaxID=2874478 RepID=UPI001CC7A367|nr:hypothetical protein [Nocardioides sp. TRM66260-LWL]MBZ5735705.1 hypothetical protein [Nocardioides sp. TRM66260-LWL]